MRLFYNMDLFRQYITKIYPLSEAAIMLLYENMTYTKCEKRTLLIKEGEYKKKVYFLLSGLAKAYTLKEGKEQTAWFVEPGQFFFPSLTNTYATISSVNVELIYSSELFFIPQEQLELLFLTSLELSNWGRCYLQKTVHELEHFFASDFFLNATEQYEKMLMDNPMLLQKISLKQLASFLNITPESLSRIRTKIKS